MDTDPDFWTVYKIIPHDEQPELPESVYQPYFDRGVFPDILREYVGSYESEQAAEATIQDLEDARTKDGWVAYKKPRWFKD